MARSFQQFLPIVLVSIGSGSTASQDVDSALRVYVNGAVEQPIQVARILKGSFGGVAGVFVRVDATRGYFDIPTSYEGRNARSAKAIIFCSGYRSVWIDVPDVDESSELLFELEPLPTRTLSGTIEFVEGAAPRSFSLDISLMVFAAHQYFGIADGAVTRFAVVDTPVDEFGNFSVDVPDLKLDNALSDSGTSLSNSIRFEAREKSTGNYLFDVDPEMLPIQELPDGALRLRVSPRSEPPND